MSSKDSLQSTGDRFTPCLMARLTDLKPEEKTELYGRGISVHQFKQNILWNVENILNSKSHLNYSDYKNDPAITDSVLGVGLSDFCGSHQSSREYEKLRNEVERQIRLFEPRLNPDTLRVDCMPTNNTLSKGTLELEIRAQLNVAPLDEELVFRSKLDMESGNATVMTVGGI